MGTLLLREFKKKASGFLQEKYKTARLALTDVTEAELLAEEATNSDPWGPDARTMTRIADASFDIDDYWRIVDVLHKRFCSIDWKEWRQSYKSLVLLDFLLTHGPEDFAEEFQCDGDVIEELGTFKYVDEKGFNWGANMQKKSERVLRLLKGGEFLKGARLKALKISKEIQGFGNLTVSPVSSSSASSGASRTSSFGSYSTSSSVWNESDEPSKNNEQDKSSKPFMENYSQGGLPSEKPTTFSSVEGSHLWDSPIQESGSLLDPDEEDEEKMDGKVLSRPFVSNGSSSTCDVGKAVIRSFSDVGKEIKKKLYRQFSTRY
ncbi:Epsin domain [Macleaya cordata]|uniref:Epsin domain n=1 Tax=Macleaya cordata TaxID=56857 RepID=A0A200QAJ2_MACCD|nr:Epsin domain [Macleaya cordata]